MVVIGIVVMMLLMICLFIGIILYVVIIGLVDGCYVVFLLVLMVFLMVGENFVMVWGFLIGISFVIFMFGFFVVGELMFEGCKREIYIMVL